MILLTDGSLYVVCIKQMLAFEIDLKSLKRRVRTANCWRYRTWREIMMAKNFSDMLQRNFEGKIGMKLDCDYVDEHKSMYLLCSWPTSDKY